VVHPATDANCFVVFTQLNAAECIAVVEFSTHADTAGADVLEKLLTGRTPATFLGHPHCTARVHPKFVHEPTFDGVHTTSLGSEFCIRDPGYNHVADDSSLAR
jgi:hypothetical protein